MQGELTRPASPVLDEETKSFVRRALNAGLVDIADLKKVVISLLAESEHVSPQRLADRLVGGGYLTRFQASKLLAVRGRVRISERAKSISALPHSDRKSNVQQTTAQVGSMVSGAAWDNVEIASLLDAEDEAERNKRYEMIRSQGKDASQRSRSASAADHPTEDGGDDSGPVDVKLFADAFDEESTTETVEKRGPRGLNSKGEFKTKTRTAKHRKPSKQQTDAEHAESQPARVKPKRPPRPRKRSRWFALAGSTDRLKLLAICVLAIMAIGLLACQVHRFSAGPEVRLLPNLD